MLCELANMLSLRRENMSRFVIVGSGTTPECFVLLNEFVNLEVTAP